MSAPKKTKLGKTRLDKFYHLAKEQGFRSRAAFKLIQLNKKYDFLSTARATLDLCAAPGSWMQVAAKYMPMSSLVVGIDLDKIKPIKGCIGIEGDITTQKARNDIKKALNSWKVDVCLHDGAPNVGASWILDAYAQAELVLHSLKLATEFLREGGWFVTKIFRSKDYNSLIWAFQQLFKKVEATKPMASRNTSAEIFVVCQGYLDPKYIDPKLLDPRYIFKELEEAAPVVNVFGKQPRRPSRLGYEEGNVTLHKKVDASDFVDAEDPIKQLGMFNQISFSENSKQYEDHPSTTDEIKELCKDLKVCSKGDYKLLLRWRTGLVEYKKELSGEKVKEEEEEEEEEEELTLEEQEFRLDQELSERLKDLKHKQMKDVKKKKHKESQKRAKVQTLRDMGAVQSGEGANLEISEAGLFELDRIKSDQLLDGIADTEAPDFDENEIQDKKREDQIIAEYEDRVNAVYDDADSDKEDAENNYRLRMEEDFDREFEEKLEKSKNKKDKQILAKSQKKKKKEEEEDKRLDQILTTRKVGNERFIPNVSSDPFGSDSENDERIRKEEGSDDDADDSNDSGHDEDEDLDERDFKAPKAKVSKTDKSKSNSLMVQDTVVAPTISKRADRWFAQDLFKENEIVAPKRKSRIDISDSEEEVDTDEEIRNIRASQAKKNKELKNGKKRKNKNDSDSDSDEEDSFGDKYRNNKKKKEKDLGFEEVKQDDIASDLSDMDDDEKAKVLAIGTLIVNNPSLKRDLVDNAYNRYAFNEDTLPTWFTSEESNHNVPTLPVTREEIKEMKTKFKELDARPIKKVAEARARKRMKSAKQADQIKQKASMIADSSEMTAGQKTKAIEGLYKELKGRPKLEKKYVVMRSFMKGKVNRGQKEKGKKVKAVDPRMKKDMKRSKETNRGKGKGKSGYKGKKGPKINDKKKK